MSSLDISASSPTRPDETVQIALLLAFAGGYIDAYSWIIHGVMANAQTANLVLFWVYGAGGKWEQALLFVPPMLAFAVGTVMAAWLRRATGTRVSAISALIEIALLVMIGILHNRSPHLAGTLGLSLVAAIQAANFTKVQGATYSSVMVTGDLRLAIEGLFAAISSSGETGALRRSGVYVSVCVAFGMGVAAGAFATKSITELALGLPVVALLIVLLRCDLQRHEQRI
jgi:uncharacterized membrane protein YoaK (UPF0700 family)